MSPSRFTASEPPDPASVLPRIGSTDSFVRVVKALSVYFVDEITTVSEFEELRVASSSNQLRILVDHLVTGCLNPVLINALLTLRWHFSTLGGDDRLLNETRAHACEIVAWRFLTHLSERDAVDFCLYELPTAKEQANKLVEPTGLESERSSLLPRFRAPSMTSKRSFDLLQSIFNAGELLTDDDDDEGDPTTHFAGLNGLEIAAVADCKKFLSQHIVQKIIDGIWKGDITFWDSLNENTVKMPQFHERSRSDPFTRLRVPRYVKTFEIIFFAMFLALYYVVLMQRNSYHINAVEALLYVWCAAFAYDELSEFLDAGTIFYAIDLWNGADIVIVLIGSAFLFCRALGLAQGNDRIIGLSFDILSLEALFMIPRICSILSLYPYFGTMIRILLADFKRQFLMDLDTMPEGTGQGLCQIHGGFLTTFALLARDTFTLSQLNWMLLQIFYDPSAIGLGDFATDLNPRLGPPLMLIYITMTNILLLTILIGILTDTYSRVVSHTREEYLFLYSIYVLEASTSNRLTHFYPPLNIIALVLIRPLRLFVTAARLRKYRIILLKITHAPIVLCIWLYERIRYGLIKSSGVDAFSSASPDKNAAIAKIKKQRPFLSKAKESTASKLQQGQCQFDGHSSDLALEERVAELSRKIEALTALLMTGR